MESREATFEERATWGECPACHAKHGEWCNPDVGFPLGMNIHGKCAENGVHLGRLQRAPSRVRLVAA